MLRLTSPSVRRERSDCAAMDGTAVAWQHFAQADWAAARDAFAAALEQRPGRPRGARRARPVAVVARRARRRRSSAAARPTRPTSAAATRRDAGGLADLPRRRAPHRRPARRGRRAGSRGRGACSPTRAPCPSSAGSTIEEAKRAADPADAERHARAALDVAHALADPDVECMALAQLGRAVVRQGRVDEGVGAARRGDDGRARRRDERPAGLRRRVLHDARRLRRPGRPRSARRSGARPSSSSPSGGASCPVQSWCRGDLRRACSCARATGSAPRPCSPRRCGAAPTGAAAAAARCRSSVLAELRLRQGRSEEAEQLLDGPRGRAGGARRRSCELHLERGDLRARARALLDRARRRRRELLRAAGRGRAGARATSARRRPSPSGCATRREALARRGPRRARRRCSRAARPSATTARPQRSSRTPSPASPRCASRSRRRGRGWRSRASRPRPARRSRSRGARGARRLRAPRRARATPTGPPRCCASSAPPAAPRRAASATS